MILITSRTMMRRIIFGFSLPLLTLSLIACSSGFPTNLIHSPISTATPQPTALPEPTAEPTAILDETISGRLAVIDTNGRLLTTDATGELVKRLSTDESIFRFPAWSPVNNQIAVIGDNPTTSGIFVFEDIEQNDPTIIYDQNGSAPIYLYWLPNGESVSFITNDFSELAFFIAPADGSAESEQLNMGQPFYWQWLSNSEQALIHNNDDNLAFMDRKGAESATGLGSQGAFQAPALSASNRYLAYQDLQSNGRFITIKNLTEDEIVLKESHRGLLTMSWSPVKSQLAYSSPQGESIYHGPLLLWDASEGKSRVLTTDPVVAFFWSPDGRYITYLTFEQMGQQARVPHGLAQQRLFLTLGIIHVETGGQRYLTAFEPNPIFVNQFIPYFDQYALSHRLWSPDSKAIAMPVLNDDEEAEILIIPIDSRAPYPVSKGFLAFWSHQ